MELYVSCDCGWFTVAAGNDLIASVREHGLTVHDIALSDEQIMAAARPYVAGTGGAPASGPAQREDPAE